MIEGSIGLEFGGVEFSEIIFFQDKRAYDEFTSGKFEFGATAQAVVVTAGVQGQAGTAGKSAGASGGPKTGVQAETDYVKGMATFVQSKGGLMYEASIGGKSSSLNRCDAQSSTLKTRRLADLNTIGTRPCNLEIRAEDLSRL